MNRLASLLVVICTIFFGSGCLNDKRELVSFEDSGYPPEVASIFVGKCALAGCHNSKSKDGAAGLDLSTWSHLFEGTRNGSGVFPFRADQSYLTYFINTYNDLGFKLLPTMPNLGTSLSRQEVKEVIDWINSGAPDLYGKVMWSDNPDRQKFYVVNQGCNSVTIFDSQSRLPMRYVNVGDSVNKSPHDVVVSPDGAYWYVIFYAGQILQKYSTATDSLISQVNLGNGQWSAMKITEDSKYAFVIDWNASGSIAYVDLQSMIMPIKYQGPGLLVYPHGCNLSSDYKTLYVTAQSGNFIYKIDITDALLPSIDQVVLQPGTSPSTAPSLDPHQIEFTPDGSKYFVSCQRSNEIRVFNAANDSLLAVIPTGDFPQEMEISENTDYLFVSCEEDISTFPGKRGSVAVINYKTNTFIKAIYTGCQPHGLHPDDNRMLVYVANRNVSNSGPAPHHASTCGGRNGTVTIIDMNTLELLPGYQVEVNVDPYEIGVRE